MKSEKFTASQRQEKMNDTDKKKKSYCHDVFVPAIRLIILEMIWISCTMSGGK